MNRKFSSSHGERYTADSVIAQGYALYDQWNGSRASSRSIVEYVKRAVDSLRVEMTATAYILALACLFALDMRIKEKYKGFFRWLFSYFSWRRETRALEILKRELQIPKDLHDIRTAIAIVLPKIREKLELEEADGDEDGARGGKRNSKSDAETELAASEQTKESEMSENVAEEPLDAEDSKEAMEEKAEEKPTAPAPAEASEQPSEAPAAE